MFSPTDTATDLPPLPPDGRWWGEHLREIRWQLEQIHERDGRRVALIGHSRGGLYSRALACRRPELVSHAIALGAGLRQMLAISYPTLVFVDRVRRRVLSTGRARSSRCMTAECDCAFTGDMLRPFPRERVRLSSVYSKGDGVVRWQAAVVPYGDCNEVTGSHVGLIFNRSAYRATATALARPELP